MAEKYGSERFGLQPNPVQLKRAMLVDGERGAMIKSPDDSEYSLSDIADSRQRNTTSGHDSRSSRAGSGLTERSRSDSEIEAVAGDNVRVVVRVRPVNTTETERCDKSIIKLPGEGAVWIDNSYGQIKPFTFNETFGDETSQSQMFEHCGIKNLIDMTLEGYSCTCFAFGQTGSGKTHTITGPITLDSAHTDEAEILPPKDLQGLIQRSFHYLFEHIDNTSDETTCTVRASYLEVYNEKVKDLLNPSSAHDSLPVRWSRRRGFYVENLFYVECDTVDDVMAVLEEGLRFRHVGSHAVNDYSSRSHSMLTLYVDSEMVDPDDETGFPIVKHGKLSLVDLAGSERVKETKSVGGTFAESQKINQSLLTLGNCISALSDPKKKSGGHIPYRDSKLTKLLADSLGGDGVTLMIACISPGSYVVQDTLNTLRYASRAKKIKNKPVVQMDPKEKLIISLRREIKLLRTENAYFRNQLGISALGNDSQMTLGSFASGGDDSTDGVDENANCNTPPKEQESSKHLLALPLPNDEQNRVTTASNPTASSGLYDMLQEYMTENECLRHENAELLHTREEVSRQQTVISRENERLVKKLEELERVFTSSPCSLTVGSSLSGDQTLVLPIGHQSFTSGPSTNLGSPKSQPEPSVSLQRSNSVPGNKKPRSTSEPPPPSINRGISLPVIINGPYPNYVVQGTWNEEQVTSSPVRDTSSHLSRSTVDPTPTPTRVSARHQITTTKNTPPRARKRIPVMEPKPVKPATYSSYAKRFAKQKEKKPKGMQSKKETTRRTNELSPGPASQGEHPAYELGAGRGTDANLRYEPQFGRHVGTHPGYESQDGQQYRVPAHMSYPPEVTTDHRQPNYYYSPQHKPTSEYSTAISERLRQELNDLDSQIQHYNQMNQPRNNLPNKTNPQRRVYHPPR